MLEIWDLVWAKSKPIERDENGKVVKSSPAKIIIYYFDESQQKVISVDNQKKEIMKIFGWEKLTQPRFDSLLKKLKGQKVATPEDIYTILKKEEWEQLTLF